MCKTLSWTAKSIKNCKAISKRSFVQKNLMHLLTLSSKLILHVKKEYGLYGFFKH